MARDLFSVPIFFIILVRHLACTCNRLTTLKRETIEAGIIVSVLLAFVEQLVTTGTLSTTSSTINGQISTQEKSDDDKRMAKLLRRMRIQVWAGAVAGFVIALAIGAVFIAVVSTGLRLFPYLDPLRPSAHLFTPPV